MGQGGREMGKIILVKIWDLIGEVVKQWREQLMIWFYAHNILLFQKCPRHHE
jgi:hypothetical protein